MSKTIMGLIFAVIIIGGGIMLINKNNSGKNDNDNIDGDSSMMENEMNSENENSENNTENSNSKKMAFDVFLKQGGSYECTVNQNFENVTSSGKVWIDGATGSSENVRINGEFESTVAGQSFVSHMIVRDGFTYTWSSAMPSVGMKIKNTGAETINTNQNTSGNITWDAKNIGDYNCNAWTTQESKFALPKGVTFTEIGS